MSDRNRILLVEDDHDFAESLNLLLQIKGFETIVTNSGEEALDVYSEQEFDCILMDIKLPGITGVETLSRILEQAPGAKILLMTGCERGSPEVLSASLAGAAGVLYKPFRINDLLSIINKQL